MMLQPGRVVGGPEKFRVEGREEGGGGRGGAPERSVQLFSRAAHRARARDSSPPTPLHCSTAS
jgi:hypothetical protein